MPAPTPTKPTAKPTVETVAMVLALSSVSCWLEGQRLSVQPSRSLFLPRARKPVIPPTISPAPPTPSAMYAGVLDFLLLLSAGGTTGPTTVAGGGATGGGVGASAAGSFSSVSDSS